MVPNISAEVLRTLALPSHPGKSLPYQSIYRGSRILMRGERTDLRDRHNLICWEDLAGKSVLDIGCCLGSASLMAMDEGAGLVTGIDRSEGCITAAQEIATILGYRHDFRVMDASNPVGLGRYDTAFCFSVLRHVDARPAMRLADVVWVEANAKTPKHIPPELADEWACEHVGQVGPRGLWRLTLR